MRRYSFNGLIYDFCKRYTNKSAFKYRPSHKLEIEKFDKYVIKTYKDVYLDLLTLKHFFKENNIDNKKIALLGRNSYIWSLIMMTTLTTNNILVPLDKELKHVEFLSSLERSESDILFYDDKFEEKVNKIKETKDIKAFNFNTITEYIFSDNNLDFEYLTKEYKKEMENLEKHFKAYEDEKGFEKIKDTPKNFEEDVNSLEDVKVMLFTSGTTAMSKLVLITRENLITNVYDVCEHENIPGFHTEIALLPAHHIFGLTCILVLKNWGFETTYPDSLKQFANNLKEYKVSIFVGVPLILEAIYERVKKVAIDSNKWNLLKVLRKVSNFLRFFKIDIRRKLFKSVLDPLGGSLEYIISGAAALNKEVYTFFDDIGVNVFPGYGLSETSPVVAAEHEGFQKMGSIGETVEHVDLKIDKNSLMEHYQNTLDLNKEENLSFLENIKNGDEGEIIVKGKSIFKGYYKDLEKTKDAFVGDSRWFRTGDIGYIKDGFIFITGRIKDMIVLENGKKAFPEEIEHLINNIPEVSESFVFASNKNLGFGNQGDLKIYAKIKYDPKNQKFKNKSHDEIYDILWEEIKKINKTLPSYKYIKGIFISTEDFTKTTTQKIKRFIEKEKTEKENTFE